MENRLSDDEATRRLRHLRAGVERSGVDVTDVVLPESHQVVAGGTRLHFLDWRGPGARDVLFLHGGGLTAHTWDLACLALRDDYRCIAPDLRGHGDSEWSPVGDYSIAAHAGDLEEFVNALGLEDFVLVGMSLGGLTAIEYAGRHSSRLSGLVIVDVAPGGRAEARNRIRAFIEADGEFASADDFIERALRFNNRRDPELLRGSMPNNLRRLPNGRWTWKHDRRHYAAFDWRAWEASVAALSDRLPDIACPTLVVRGADSDVISDDDAERLAGSLSDASWVRISGAGHVVQGDNPAALAGALRGFLDRLPA